MNSLRARQESARSARFSHLSLTRDDHGARPPTSARTRAGYSPRTLRHRRSTKRLRSSRVGYRALDPHLRPPFGTALREIPSADLPGGSGSYRVWRGWHSCAWTFAKDDLCDQARAHALLFVRHVSSSASDRRALNRASSDCPVCSSCSLSLCGVVRRHDAARIGWP